MTNQVKYDESSIGFKGIFIRANWMFCASACGIFTKLKRYKSNVRLSQCKFPLFHKMDCPICFTPIPGVSSLSCGHTFCSACLTQLIETRAATQQARGVLCPLCQCALTWDEITTYGGNISQEVFATLALPGLIHSAISTS